MGVFPTRQDLDDNAVELVGLHRVSLKLYVLPEVTFCALCISIFIKVAV